MHLLFAAEDVGTLSRAGYLIGALLSEGHRITIRVNELKNGNDENKSWIIPLRKIVSFSKVENNYDIIFFGLTHVRKNKIPEGDVTFLEKSNAKIAFFQNDDSSEIFLDRIPNVLRQKAVLYLRNHWPADQNLIPIEIRDRTGFLNSFLQRYRPRRSVDLKLRQIDVSFYGTNTGTINGDKHRENAVRMIRETGLCFQGGLTVHDEYFTPEDLLVNRISSKKHRKSLCQTKISLALWGNSPLTYRFFESLSTRCLVLAQDLSGLKFISGGIEPFRHYIPIRADLRDMVDKIRYYLSHIEEAQKIADEGFSFFKRNYSFKGHAYPKSLTDEITNSWNQHYIADGQKSLWNKVSRPVMHLIKRI